MEAYSVGPIAGKLVFQIREIRVEDSFNWLLVKEMTSITKLLLI